MAKLHVVDFKQDHLDRIELKQIHQGEVPEAVMTRAVTVMNEDQPIAIFGAFAPVPGVVHVWGMISEKVRECPLAFHRTCESLLDFYTYKENPRRIQMDVRVNYMEGLKWARMLGFEEEGIMKNYGIDGSDYWLLGRYS